MLTQNGSKFNIFMTYFPTWCLISQLITCIKSSQTLSDDDFEDVTWEEAKVLEGLKDGDGKNLLHYRMDILWYYIANMKLPRSNAKHFKLLQKVAEIILIIPHSNAHLERLFSIV